MHIPKVKALFLQNEYTTNSYPMLLACSDGHNYFVKKSNGTGDIDLVYEVIADKLAQLFKIETPRIAFVEIPSGAIDENIVKFNTNIPDGTFLFGSQEIKGALELVKETTTRITTKNEYNRIDNPDDLITIALFDAHIGNKDRTYNNFNLLYDLSGGKQKIIAFDHVAIFDKVSDGNINTNSEVNFTGCILDNLYGKQILKYLHRDKIKEKIEEYFEKIDEIQEVVNATFETFPPTWRYNDDLRERIIRFLTDQERIISLRSEIRRFLQLS